MEGLENIIDYRVMCDWVNAIIPYRHYEKIDGGITRREDHSREVIWSQGHKRILRPSYDSTVAIQSSPEHFEVDKDGVVSWTHIHVSGSPKVLQGHNCWGPPNPLTLACLLARCALRALQVDVTPMMFHRWKTGKDITITKVDLTAMFHLDSQEEAETWIRAGDRSARLKFRGLAHMKGSTLYFGAFSDQSKSKGSKYWLIKIYPKWPEIHSHRKGHGIAFAEGSEEYEALSDYAFGSLRFELSLLPRELKRLNLVDGALVTLSPEQVESGKFDSQPNNLTNGETWLKVNVYDLWSKYMQQLEFPETYVVPDEAADVLTAGEYKCFAQWKDGVDVVSKYKRPTLYRHRKSIKNKLRIDIFVPKTMDQCQPKVIPLVKLLTAAPRPLPERVLRTGWLMAA